MQELYADIVLPLARGPFTFAVGEALRDTITEGRCVAVQLGPKKLYTGVVWRLHGEKPPYERIKTIDSYIENAPLIPDLQRRFWEWVSSYYMCSPGEVMAAALPSALKPSGFSGEELAGRTFRPRTEQFVRLDPGVDCEEVLNERFDRLRRAKRQYEALVEICEGLGGGLFGGEVPRRSLRADAAILKVLLKKGILVVEEKEIDSGAASYFSPPMPELSPAQQEAKSTIISEFNHRDVVLLHGVTGSGKTEIYISLIDEQIRAGKSVLYLTPEIAMTSQLVGRMRAYFDDRLVVYHSGMNTRARVEGYVRAAKESGLVLMGTRSAVFLPPNNVGLVIIDEEHDQSYKQAEPAPRYHARDSAVVLARLVGAKVLLGSATPAIESWVNAAEGKYGLVTLSERYGGSRLPRILVSDTITAVKRGERTAHFNKSLLDRIAATLEAGQQVLLFQNRRGFAPYVECPQCGWTPVCPGCNVAMTLHKSDNTLRCHYCGRVENNPAKCLACAVTAPVPKGFGTEKVEEELRRIFPSARVERLDRDTVRSERRYRETIRAFERGGIDILVGTQMITKGFDFEGVALVGVLNADNLLNYPDFRAAERAFQILTQAAGRAGRRDVQGEVVIQTAQPHDPVIRFAADGDYPGMVAEQLGERRQFFYPPYCRLVSVVLRHKDQALLAGAAEAFAAQGRRIFGEKLLGPQAPPVDRVRGEYLLTLLLKVPRAESFAAAKEALAGIAEKLRADKRYRRVELIFNVDPQ